MQHKLKQYAWPITIFGCLLAIVSLWKFALLYIIGNYSQYSSPRLLETYSIPLDAFFGAQVIVLAVIAVGLIIAGAIRKQTPHAVSGAIIALGVALVAAPAFIMYETRHYIVGEGGPAGPDLTCLKWDPAVINYTGELRNNVCTVLNIPSYNKYLWVRNVTDETTTAPYVSSFLASEGIIVTSIGGALYAHSRLTDRATGKHKKA